MKSMISYTHLMEYLPGKECLTSGIFMFIDGLVIVITPMLIHFISKDLNFLFIIAFSLNAISTAGFLFLKVPDSTKFLLINERFDKFECALGRI